MTGMGTKLIAWVVVLPLVLFGLAIGVIPIIFFGWQQALIGCLGGGLVCLLALTSIRESILRRDDPAQSSSAAGDRGQSVPPFE